VAHALVRGAAAFWSTLLRRPPRTISVLAPSVRVPPRTTISSGLPTVAGVENRCPVCQARFRGARVCSRCGAALEPLMRLTVRAWQLRQAARQAFDAGDFGRALELVTEAQATQNTEAGESLRLLAAWLNLV